MKSTLIKKAEGTIDAEDSAEDCIVVDDRTDRAELRDQIAQLPIESLFSLDEFLNPKDETIVNKDGDIFAIIVECYSVDRPGEEEESSDKEEEVEQIEDAKVLRIVKRLKL